MKGAKAKQPTKKSRQEDQAKATGGRQRQNSRKNFS
jgi:hypothetical protein